MALTPLTSKKGTRSMPLNTPPVPSAIRCSESGPKRVTLDFLDATGGTLGSAEIVTGGQYTFITGQTYTLTAQ